MNEKEGKIFQTRWVCCEEKFFTGFIILIFIFEIVWNCVKKKEESFSSWKRAKIRVEQKSNKNKIEEWKEADSCNCPNNKSSPSLTNWLFVERKRSETCQKCFRIVFSSLSSLSMCVCRRRLVNTGRKLNWKKLLWRQSTRFNRREKFLCVFWLPNEISPKTFNTQNFLFFFSPQILNCYVPRCFLWKEKRWIQSIKCSIFSRCLLNEVSLSQSCMHTRLKS